jgi:uncharacterized membrane protein
MKVADSYSKITTWNTLIIKVVLYSAVVLIGIGMVVYAFEQHQEDYSVFKPNYAFSLSSLWASLQQLEGYGIMSLGIVLLVMIPFVKILGILSLFIAQKNILYITISAIILAVFVGAMMVL